MNKLAMMMKMMMTVMMLVAVVEAESSCMWLRKQKDHTGSQSSKFQEYNNYTISMLRKMQGNTTNNSSAGELLHFPDKQYDHASKLMTAYEKLVFLVDTLVKVSRVFDSESLNNTNWHQRDVDMFNNELFRQITELRHCVKIMGVASSHSVTKLTHKTKLHFKALERTLQDKDYSASVWEDVRVTLLTHLQRLDLFAAKI